MLGQNSASPIDNVVSDAVITAQNPTGYRQSNEQDREKRLQAVISKSSAQIHTILLIPEAIGPPGQARYRLEPLALTRGNTAQSAEFYQDLAKHPNLPHPGP